MHDSLYTKNPADSIWNPQGDDRRKACCYRPSRNSKRFCVISNAKTRVERSKSHREAITKLCNVVMGFSKVTVTPSRGHDSNLWKWIRRESNPRPKAHSAYFYDHILFLRIAPFPASGERTVNLAGLVASSYAHSRKA